MKKYQEHIQAQETHAASMDYVREIVNVSKQEAQEILSSNIQPGLFGIPAIDEEVVPMATGRTLVAIHSAGGTTVVLPNAAVDITGEAGNETLHISIPRSSLASMAPVLTRDQEPNQEPAN